MIWGRRNGLRSGPEYQIGDPTPVPGEKRPSRRARSSPNTAPPTPIEESLMIPQPPPQPEPLEFELSSPPEDLPFRPEDEVLSGASEEPPEKDSDQYEMSFDVESASEPPREAPQRPEASTPSESSQPPAARAPAPPPPPAGPPSRSPHGGGGGTPPHEDGHAHDHSGTPLQKFWWGLGVFGLILWNMTKNGFSNLQKAFKLKGGGDHGKHDKKDHGHDKGHAKKGHDDHGHGKAAAHH